MGRDEDMTARVGTGTVDGVLGRSEEARELTLALFAIRGTQGSGGRLAENAAIHGVLPFLESGSDSTKCGVSVLESC